MDLFISLNLQKQTVKVKKMQTALRKKVLAELKQIPEQDLESLLELIRQFRNQRQKAQNIKSGISDFSGCWKDMPEEDFLDFLNEIAQRRRFAFSRRRYGEADAG